MKKSKREPAGGARRLRRFTPRMVFDVRPAFARRTLKRPEGRAPSVFHAVSLDFRSRRSGVVRPRGMTLGGYWTRGPRSGRPHSHSAEFWPTRFRLLHTARCAARKVRYRTRGITASSGGGAGGWATPGAFVVAVGTVSAPASSSGRMVMAIRRLRERPSAVALSATGRNSP